MSITPAPETVHVRWRVVPLATPRVVRRCSQCNGSVRFISSDNFRLNAQQRRVDVWLIYRCERCSNTWNRPLFERTLPEVIGAELYQLLLRNDPITAWDTAFDIRDLRRRGLEVDTAVPLKIETEQLAAPTG
ncbi:MAG TPA: DUF1062 domain-containing protein, partial [Candidatus Acidoferrales bacterium]|nr:DUF1062 domain-containing protein [Candidatus Acidoferrales bacterium]